jgi:hypothetical protein
MTDLETLLERLRDAAVDHAAAQSPDRVPVRSWPPAVESGARRALIDAWAGDRSTAVARFLVPDPDEFVDLAFLSLLGRPADPVGRSHYLGRLQQGIPRFGSHHSQHRPKVSPSGSAAWPPGFVLCSGDSRFPGDVRRATRSDAASRGPAPKNLGSATVAWRLAVAIDERERYVIGELPR